MKTELRRCSWVNMKNPLYVSYHDNEWGKTGKKTDGYYFEMLLLESFQAGLSWECVLNKREAFRKAFDGFDYRLIARYDDEKTALLRENKDIIRNKLKISAAVNNAGAFIKITEEYGSFAEYLGKFTKKSIINRDGAVRASSPLSDKISADLKKRGMKFVGTTIIYSFLQAVGVIDDHEPECFCAGISGKNGVKK